MIAQILKMTIAVLSLLALGACATVSRSEISSWNQAFQSFEVDERGIWRDQSGNEVYIKSVSKLPISDARRLFEERRHYYQSLYAKHRDPYFGDAAAAEGKTAAAECLAKQKLSNPVQDESHGLVLTLEMKATVERVLGICDPKVENRFAYLMFVYCKETQSTIEIRSYSQTMIDWKTRLPLVDICRLPAAKNSVL